MIPKMNLLLDLICVRWSLSAENYFGPEVGDIGVSVVC
jgi:hypothetical protein